MYFSPLFSLIQILKKENHSLINPCGVQKMQKKDKERAYFLIPLQEEVGHSVLKDFKLKESHFSVDEKYKLTQGTHGLTPIHYTQIYISPIDHSELTIHMYLNSKGEYQYAKVKSLSKAIILTSEQENHLKRNITFYQPFFKDLIKEQHYRQNKLKKQADELEQELTDLSRTLNEKTAREEYLLKARKFIEVVQNFNEMSELKDQDLRATLVSRMFKNIAAIENPKSFETKHESLQLQDKGELKEQGGGVSQSSIEDLYKEFIEKFLVAQENFNKISDLNIEAILLKKQLADEINEYILTLYSFPASFSKRSHFKKIVNMVENLNQFYKNMSSLLKQQVKEGKLEELKVFLPVLKKYLDEEFYYELISSLVEGKNILDICEYLNENDLRYRKMVEKISKDKRYFLSSTLSLFFKNNQQKYQGSLLFLLYCENKLDLFKILLRHGACSNTWGVTYESRESAPPFRLFYSIGAMGSHNQSDYIPYLRTLLEYNVDPNEIYTKDVFISTQSNNIKLLTQKKYYEKQLKKKVSHFHYTTLIEYENLSLIFSQDKGLEGFSLLLPYMNLFDLVVSLSTIMRTAPLREKIIISDEYGIHCEFNLVDATIKAVQYAKTGVSDVKAASSDLFVCSIFYPDPDSNDSANKDAKEQLQKIAKLSKCLDDKVKALTFNEFDKLYQTLFEKAEGLLVNQSFVTALEVFKACEIVLFKKYQSIKESKDSKESKKLVKDYMIPLYSKLHDTFYKVYAGNDAASFIEPRTVSLNSLTKAPLQQAIKFTPSVSKALVPLCVAAQGNADKLGLLLLQIDSLAQINISSKETKGWTPLHFACKSGNSTGDFTCAKKLIKAGSNITLKNEKNKTPLDLITNPEFVCVKGQLTSLHKMAP